MYGALINEIAELKGKITELKEEITELEGTMRQYQTWLVDARKNDRDLVVVYADLISKSKGNFDKLLDLIKLKEESLILLQQEARQLLTQQSLTSGGNLPSLSLSLSLDMSLSLIPKDHQCR
jgi:hypothetical protein